MKENWNDTKLGRAKSLLSSYRANDKKRKRGKTTITAKWIVENILSKPCVHCGETDWRKVGCNRLDNAKSHTPDNVEPCCWYCNNKLGHEFTKELQSKNVYQYTKDDKLVKIWDSLNDVVKGGFNSGCVGACCRGGCFRDGKWQNAKTHKGYKWSYEPL